MYDQKMATCGAATGAREHTRSSALAVVWRADHHVSNKQEMVSLRKERVATCGPAARAPGSAPAAGAAGGGHGAGVAAGVGTGAGGGVGAPGLVWGLTGPAAASGRGAVGTATADGSALAAGACHTKASAS